MSCVSRLLNFMCTRLSGTSRLCRSQRTNRRLCFWAPRLYWLSRDMGPSRTQRSAWWPRPTWSTRWFTSPANCTDFLCTRWRDKLSCGFTAFKHNPTMFRIKAPVLITAFLAHQCILVKVQLASSHLYKIFSCLQNPNYNWWMMLS